MNQRRPWCHLSVIAAWVFFAGCGKSDEQQLQAADQHAILCAKAFLPQAAKLSARTAVEHSEGGWVVLGKAEAPGRGQPIDWQVIVREKDGGLKCSRVAANFLILFEDGVVFAESVKPPLRFPDSNSNLVPPELRSARRGQIDD